VIDLLDAYGPALAILTLALAYVAILLTTERP
jgi:hypothetical protein